MYYVLYHMLNTFCFHLFKQESHHQVCTRGTNFPLCMHIIYHELIRTHIKVNWFGDGVTRIGFHLSFGPSKWYVLLGTISKTPGFSAKEKSYNLVKL